MAKILTIECGDDGVVAYRLTKPTMRKLEAAQSVLASLEIAVPRDDDHAKVVAAHDALLDVMAIFKVEDEGEPEPIGEVGPVPEQAEPCDTQEASEVEAEPNGADHPTRRTRGRRPACNGGETL